EHKRDDLLDDGCLAVLRVLTPPVPARDRVCPGGRLGRLGLPGVKRGPLISERLRWQSLLQRMDDLELGSVEAPVVAEQRAPDGSEDDPCYGRDHQAG